MLFRRVKTQGKVLATGKLKKEKAAHSKVGLFNVIHTKQPSHHRAPTFKCQGKKTNNRNKYKGNTKHKKESI